MFTKNVISFRRGIMNKDTLRMFHDFLMLQHEFNVAQFRASKFTFIHIFFVARKKSFFSTRVGIGNINDSSDGFQLYRVSDILFKRIWRICQNSFVYIDYILRSW